MNLIEISNKFPSELDCVRYFEKLRWGKNIKCAYCDSDSVSERNPDMRFNCRDCNKTFSVTVNTNIHNTRLSLKTWLYAVAVITDAKKGISAKQLERNLGVHYETAWTMYHKIRLLMEDEDLELEGVVEMDETYVGGKPRKGRASDKINLTEEEIFTYDRRIDELSNRFEIKEGTYKKRYDPKPHKRGRGTKKIPVVGIIERDGDVIAEVMKHTSYKNLKEMVMKYVDEDNALLITDNYPAYNKFSNIIEHLQVDHKRMFSCRGINTNSIESFLAIIKRGIIGQYHCVSPKYLPNYITEFVFKYNNRKEEKTFEILVKKLIESKI